VENIVVLQLLVQQWVLPIIDLKMWHKTFFENLAVSIKIHRISKLIVINHEDCRAARVAEGKEDIDEVKIHKISF
jgi:carbonic anhydrase